MSRVEFKNKAVAIDGTPTFLMGGEITQIRLPASEWRDRLEKMASLGLNFIGVYAAWNFHSPEAAVYDFESPDRDFGKFLDEAKRVGLYIMARPGPYICNEWDMGGFPGWLIRENPGDWRTCQEDHVKHSIEWYRRINEIIAPRQLDKDGAVILYQVENEHWWGDKALFDSLADAARKDGITVPMMSNGGGSLARCGCTSLVDGCDIYTSVYEQWRWRGWVELASRLAREAPLMVVEYNAGSFAPWGGQPAGEVILPSEWMMSLTRMFLGLGANLLNPFLVVAGITPVNLGSDHCCTAYAEDVAISHWGGLGRKFYLLRLLAEAISSANTALAKSRPVPEFWASDNGNVEGMLRDGPKGKFVVAVNGSTRVQAFHILLPDGRSIPESGTLSIPPRVSQFHMLDIDCKGGVKLEYSTAQVLKIWRDQGKLNIAVHGEEGSSGHAILVTGGNRVRIDFQCSGAVCVKRVDGTAPVTLFAVSTEVAERTWFVKLSGRKTVALFGNLDLVRPRIGRKAAVGAEILRGGKLRLLTDGVSLSVEGVAVSETRRPDGMIEYAGEAAGAGATVARVGTPSYRAENFSWTAVLPSEGGDWKRIAACRPGREVITDTGIYQYAVEFQCGADLPETLEFLGISAAETVVYLNGRRMAVFPQKRPAVYHDMDDYRLRIPVAGTIRQGTNLLAFTMTIIGRHYIGNPLYAGASHPVILYRERAETALPEWEVADFGGRRHTGEELDAASPALLNEIASRSWRKIDMANPPAFREIDQADWLDIRCIRGEIEIPAQLRGRPIFLECGKMDDAWCYANGKLVGRAYHQMSATFDLSEFSNETSVQVLIAGRNYWLPNCLPSIVPRLVTADTVAPSTFLRRDGADGDRGRYFDSPGAFEAEAQPIEAQAFWVRREVGVDIPKGIIAPMYVELDEKWNANAVLYWNGKAIGRYSIVGPDRRFFIPTGLLKKENILTVYVDGHGAAAEAGGVKVAPFAEHVALSLKFQPGAYEQT